MESEWVLVDAHMVGNLCEYPRYMCARTHDEMPGMFACLEPTVPIQKSRGGMADVLLRNKIIQALHMLHMRNI